MFFSTSPIKLLKKIRAVTLTLSVVGIVLSGYSIYVHQRKEANKDYKAFCDISEDVSCSKVFTSKWGKGLGILGSLLGEDSPLVLPNGFYGIAFYLLVIALVTMDPSHNTSAEVIKAFIRNLVREVGADNISAALLKDVVTRCSYGDVTAVQDLQDELDKNQVQFDLSNHKREVEKINAGKILKGLKSTAGAAEGLFEDTPKESPFRPSKKLTRSPMASPSFGKQKREEVLAEKRSINIEDLDKSSDSDEGAQCASQPPDQHFLTPSRPDPILNQVLKNQKYIIGEIKELKGIAATILATLQVLKDQKYIIGEIKELKGIVATVLATLQDLTEIAPSHPFRYVPPPVVPAEVPLPKQQPAMPIVAKPQDHYEIINLDDLFRKSIRNKEK